ncbi:MAG: tetratricopeptide repeat protein [Candidatus Obscuribacterales bacterium]
MKELPPQRIIVRAVLVACLTLLSTDKAALAEVDDSDSRQTNALLRTAYFQMLRGEFHLAAANHKLAVIADRDSVTARRHLGYSLLKLGNYKGALEQLHFLVVMTAPTAFDMCLYGEACLQTGQYSLAESWFGEALKSDSELINARIGLAKAIAAGKNKGTTLNVDQKPLIDEGHQDFASEQTVIQTVVSPPSIGAQSQPAISISAVSVKSKPLGNNQSHNAWDSFRGLQSK